MSDLQTPPAAYPVQLAQMYWWFRVETHILSPQSAGNCHLMYNRLETPRFICTQTPRSPHTPSLQEVTPLWWWPNHQLSPWWWWWRCHANRRQGQQAPVATWEMMMMSENKVPRVRRLEGERRVLMAKRVRVWPLLVATDLTFTLLSVSGLF